MLKNIQFWTGEKLSSDYDQVHTLEPLLVSIFYSLENYTKIYSYAGLHRELQKRASW